MGHIVKPTALTYPILGLARDTSITRFERPDSLEQCSAYAFRNEYYAGLLIIDSDLRQYVVTSFERKKANAELLDRFFDILLNRKINTDLELELQGRISLEEAKNTLVKAVDRNPDMWEAIDGLQRLKDRLRHADDFNQLIGIIG